MKKNDGVLCLIVQLILSALIAFVFSFKYKDELLTSLSEPVFYQVLVILTVISGYVATPIGYIIFNIHVAVRRKISDEYNSLIISQKIALLSSVDPKKISDKHRKMIDEWNGRDIFIEKNIDNLNKEITELHKLKDG